MISGEIRISGVMYLDHLRTAEFIRHALLQFTLFGLIYSR